jgi:hypothetical protein
LERASFHHIFWARRDYKTKPERYLRNNAGFLVPMYQDAHRTIHKELDPPPKPKERIIHGILELVRNLPNETKQDPEYQIMATAEHLLQQDDKTAARIGHHLVKQLGYIHEGRYGNTR